MFPICRFQILLILFCLEQPLKKNLKNLKKAQHLLGCMNLILGNRISIEDFRTGSNYATKILSHLPCPLVKQIPCFQSMQQQICPVKFLLCTIKHVSIFKHKTTVLNFIMFYSIKTNFRSIFSDHQLPINFKTQHKTILYKF